MNPKLFALLVVTLISSAPGAVRASTHVSIGVHIGRPAPIVVREAPPRRVAEARIISPGPGFVWVEGHYSWGNGQWVWVPGAWVTPPQPGASWVPGQWDASAGTWTEGHWIVSQPSAPPPITTPPPSVVVTSSPTTVVITSAPPTPLHEVRGRRPGRAYVWVPGYWGVHHGHHVWVSGRWTLPPRHGHHWHAPRWERRGGTYVFIEGYWR